ncbi:serine/threonine-protein kinase [Rhodopirellula sp. SWK7]|uniref:serine/threonine-protein kinase n=1 Tax=Rhodopirellula sp. SWK7 TaxID=595460 RepID=UPI0002BE395F|nr:serine/threonine-protein kinase [Rhodopirellula sp. SWK7]EMI44761.1 serine/threonine protein kinase with PASTA sensor(s) [Rhodopirellula sp. SWK7]
MIAKQNPHFETDTLRELLDERLPRSEAQRIESHLSDCEHCRTQLQNVAGESMWWDETIEVLGNSTFIEPTRERGSGSSVDASSPLHSLDASLDWIRPLLQPLPDRVADGEVVADAIGRLDQYLIDGVIGQGGMGVVLRGTDPELNRPVAIKVLSPHLAGVGAARMRFMREAQAAAAIVHPSIVPIYSVVPNARLPYLVMPCIAGGNLQQRLDREGPLELTEVLRIGLQVAEGLSAAHKNSVIHRDIKPANILVEEGNGRVLISDFGLARALDDATLTCSGMIAGTPQYMSPEQARGESLDARSDLFSMGSLLYTLATGRPPFRAESPLGVLRKITETRAKPIHEINERMPDWFDVLVSRFMDPDLSRRIASADDAVALLREVNAHLRNPTADRLPRSLCEHRRSPSLRSIVSATCLLAMVVAVVMWIKGPADPMPFKREIARPVVSSPPTATAPQSVPLSPTRFTDDWEAVHLNTELKSIQGVLDVLESQFEESESTIDTDRNSGDQK